jgi:hypothetical protein
MLTIQQRPRSSEAQSVNAFTSQLMSTLESCYRQHPKINEASVPTAVAFDNNPSRCILSCAAVNTCCKCCGISFIS